jgi:Periplasmic component of the Tol biopolymer transport system
MRCIEKHPADRWQTAEDFHNAIEGYAMTSGATAPSAAVAQSKPFAWTPQRIAVAAGVLGLVATAAITSTIAFRRNSSTVTVGATRQMTNAEGLEIHPAISPDGKMIAYVAGSNNNSQLMVKQLSGGRSIALTDTTGHVNWPQWKPDGSAILFDHLGHREIIPALGGSPLVIPGLDSMTGCSFSHKGERVACTFNGAIAIAGVKGEPPHVIPETGGGDGAAMASWSPDDKLIAFVKNGTGFQRGFNIGNIAPSSVWVARVDGGTPVRISDESHLNTSPVWTPDGALLFVSSMGGTRDIWLQRISSNLSPSGEPSRLTTGLNAHTISIDASGQTIAYSVFTTHANVWSTPIPSAPVESPQFTQVTKGNQTIESLMVSPDGKWITYDSNLNGNQDIFKMPIGGGEPQQLTHDGADHFSPHWSPDGQEIAFHGTQHGTRDIYVVDASGSTITQLTSGRSEDYSAMFTPDGNSVVYNRSPRFDVPGHKNRPQSG